MDLFAERAVPATLDLAARRGELFAEDLALRREELLAGDLDRALLRIAELEAEATALRGEVAAREDALSAAARDIAAALGTRDPLRRFPAAAQALLLERMDIMQRRDAWLALLARTGQSGALFGLGPHAGGEDPLTFLVVGSGGIGDALYLSVVVRALHAAFPAPRIVVLHDHDAARAIFADNPFVLDTVVLRGESREDFLDHGHGLDIFDLVVDVRYVVSYAAPPLSRIPTAFLRAAHARAAPWQRFVRLDWPHRNNALAREAARHGLGKLDLLGYTANLAVDRHLAPDLFAATTPGGDDPLAPLAGRAYVTIHHGAAPNMAGEDGLQTKNLPLARWVEIVQGLRAAGHAVVQLGTPAEHLIPGVELDLRGRTDLAGTARALQHARLHVDTEGGLVHLARTRRVPAVVLFGPTPPGFFGYPGNANLAPLACGDCWWTTRDWSARCPLGEEGPPCMASHEAAQVLAALPGLARKPLRLALGPAEALPSGPGGAAGIAAALGRQLAAVPGAALVLDSPELLAACLEEPALLDAAPQLLVPPALHAAAQEAAAGRLAVQPMAPGHIPADAGAHSAAFAALAAPLEAAAWLDLAAELARVTAPGGTVAMLMTAPPPPAAALRAAASARPGDLLSLDLPRGAALPTGPCLLALRALPEPEAAA